MRKTKREKTKMLKIKRRKKAKRKTFLRRFLIVSFGVLVLFFIFWGGYKILESSFRINQIQIENRTNYSDEEISQASGLNLNESWLFCNLRKSEKNIFNVLPYAENIKIKRVFFNKIKIEVENAEPFAIIKLSEENWLISKNYKILEKLEEAQEDVILFDNIKININEKERSFNFENEIEKENLNKILKVFEENNLNKIKVIDVSNPGDLFVIYGEGIKILIGSLDELDYKIATAREIITLKLNEYEKGTLDLREIKEKNRSYFTPL